MARYIDANAFKQRLEDKNIFFPALYENELNEMPTANFEEVKHGEWIVVGRTKGNSNILQCSECKKIRRGVGKSAYCRDCGAKMDGGKSE